VRAYDRAQLLRRLAAASAVGALAEAAPAAAAANPFPAHPRWRFVFVSPQTTSPLFVPTQYGIQDACDLLGCTYQWTGSAFGNVGELQRALDAAVASKAGGIAVAVVDAAALEAPIGRALAAGIPVVAFSLFDLSRPRRIAFIGEDPYDAGLRAGERLAKLCGRGELAVFVPPSAASLRRYDGVAAAVRKSGMPITVLRVLLDDDPLHQAAQIDDFVVTKRRARGMFAADITATDGVGRAIRKHGLHVRAGGYGVLPATLKLIDEGRVDFTIDEDPYLLGFVPALQLFLARYTGGLVGPVDVNTGVRFVTKSNVRPYLSSKTRYEGSSSKRKFPIS
jgi:simple sugar transport system substrate-binding protein